MSFCHIHLHSHFSPLDGLATPKQLVNRAKELGQTAIALTDHGNLHGAVQFYKAARDAKIKPILGIEAYVTMDPPNLENSEKTKDNYHMVLLAMNMTGWKNIVALSTKSFLENFYYKPRIFFNDLLQYNEGIIVTTACIGGIAGRKHHMANNKQVYGGVYDAENKTFSDMHNVIIPRLKQIKEVFQDRFYIEVQPHMFWEQQAFNAWAIQAAYNTLDAPLVLTNDVHYIEKDDQKTSMMVRAQQMSLTLSQVVEEERNGYGLGHYYLRSSEDMCKIAEAMNIPEAAENTVRIADRCDVSLELGTYQMPELDIVSNNDYGQFSTWRKEHMLDKVLDIDATIELAFKTC